MPGNVYIEYKEQSRKNYPGQLVVPGNKSYFKMRRTSDGGNGNHSVSLPIILIKL